MTPVRQTVHPNSKPNLAHATTPNPKISPSYHKHNGDHETQSSRRSVLTLSPSQNTNTTADTNLAAIIRGCMASEITEGEAGEEWQETHTTPGTLELPSRQHEMPGRPTQAAKYTRVKAQARQWSPRKQSYQLHNLQANPPS